MKVTQVSKTNDAKVKEEPQGFKPKRESKAEREKRTAKSGSSVMERQNALRAEAARKKKEAAAAAKAAGGG